MKNLKKSIVAVSSNSRTVGNIGKEKTIAFWKDLRYSFTGVNLDFTQMSLAKAIMLLSIPMVLEMVMESVFAVVDIFFVSKLGADAVAVVGVTESMMTIVYAICIGLGNGTTALVSRRIGEKRTGMAAVSAVQAIITGTIISVFIGAGGFYGATFLLQIMGLTQEAIRAGYQYTAIMFGSNIVIMLLFVINAAFRSAGDASISMRILWIANGINIILDPILIFGLGPIPALGMKGAAIATTIGRGIAVLIQFYYLIWGKGRIKINTKMFRPDFKIMKQLLKLSVWSILQLLIATSSWMFLVRIVAKFGNEVVAGYTIAIRIFIFSLLPSLGVANAASTLVGQNLGAQSPDRAEKSVWMTGYLNMLLLGISALFFISIPETFVRFFIDDQFIIQTGAECLRFISYGALFYALGMVVIQSFNGAGDTVTPMWLNFISFWILEIPLAYILAITLDFKEHGVYYAIVLSESVLALLAVYVFRKGKWKLKSV